MRSDSDWGVRGWLCPICRIALPAGVLCNAAARWQHVPIDLSDPTERQRLVRRTWGSAVTELTYGGMYLSWRSPRRLLRSLGRAATWAYRRARHGVRVVRARPRGFSFPRIPTPRGIEGTVRSIAEPKPPPFGGAPCIAYGIELCVRGREVTLCDGGSLGFDVELDDGRIVRVPPGPVMIDLSRAGGEESLAEIPGYLWWVGADPEPHEAHAPVPYERAFTVRLTDGMRVELRGELRSEATDAYRGGSVLTPKHLAIIVPS